MTNIKTYHCSQCGAQHNWHDKTLPPDWEHIGGVLRCGDCRASAQDNDTAAPDLAISETAIRLLSGAYLDLAEPDCSVITGADVAAGLRQPRFCGQTRKFYTIAQHSLLVLQLVRPIARKLGGDKGLQLMRCALMHDAAEAFLHDITRPLKMQLPDYRRIEARFELRMADRFGFKWTDYRRDTVKHADLQALAIEQRDLHGGAGDNWPILASIDRGQLTSIGIRRAWHPDEAQDRFLIAFDDLFSKEERIAA
ncbi:HD domain-containing protein [Erythrobacter sp. EC-HK427]|uniref:HD domain-containing protein n=1 Tax=Erythrobacter sp. EC-HK427 TaxID=2038396 RepID=UPI0012568A2A|nr:hypothetical protein [Erythrobacter sp. EC-HK427]VVT07181.1 Hydrolase of hd superfamily [Erythrobacter sp. EC-HK427]